MSSITPFIVSGTRHATLEDHLDEIDRYLYSFCRWWAPTQYTWLLVEGEAPGVDKLCRLIVETWRKGWEVDPVPALWSECGEGCPPGPHRRKNDTECPYAGPRRNRLMLDKYPNAPVLGMPRVGGSKPIREQSRGTWGMLEETVLRRRSSMIRPLFIPDGLW
jgi:hypothetical protein